MRTLRTTRRQKKSESPNKSRGRNTDKNNPINLFRWVFLLMVALATLSNVQLALRFAQTGGFGFEFDIGFDFAIGFSSTTTNHEQPVKDIGETLYHKIIDIEKAKNASFLSEKCLSFGGSRFIEELWNSETSLVQHEEVAVANNSGSGGTATTSENNDSDNNNRNSNNRHHSVVTSRKGSKLVRFQTSKIEIYYAENVRLVVTPPEVDATYNNNSNSNNNIQVKNRIRDCLKYVGFKAGEPGDFEYCLPKLRMIVDGKTPEQQKGQEQRKLGYEARKLGYKAKAPPPPVLEEMTQTIEYVDDDETTAYHPNNNNSNDNNKRCDVVVDFPVLLLDSNADQWNWWFFLIQMLKQYVVRAVVEPYFDGESGATATTTAGPSSTSSSRSSFSNVKLWHTMKQGQFQRPFTAGYDLLLTHTTASSKSSRRFWQDFTALGNANDTNSDNRPTTTTYCLSRVAWSPTMNDGGNKILINKKHPDDECFSSIVQSFATDLKSSLGIPPFGDRGNTTVTPAADADAATTTIETRDGNRATAVPPRIVWVARDMSPSANPTKWQQNRVIANQEEVLRELRDRLEDRFPGSELLVARFYGNRTETSFEEQALFVSKSNILIGLHGAGLNLYPFLPFGSTVIEVHTFSSTKIQKNSANFVTHIYPHGRYLSVESYRDINKKIPVEPIWTALENAVEEWSQTNAMQWA